MFVFKELVLEKEQVANMVQKTSELGDKLYPETSADGRDVVRQEVRKLTEALDALNENVMLQQQRLNESLSQLTSFEDSLSQLDQWLSNVDSKLKQAQSPKATLADKKALFQDLKVS